MATADERVAQKIGREIDEHIARLNRERAVLLAAPARISDIDAEILILQQEKARIDPRRPVVTQPREGEQLTPVRG